MKCSKTGQWEDACYDILESNNLITHATILYRYITMSFVKFSIARLSLAIAHYSGYRLEPITMALENETPARMTNLYSTL
jgi:hypothetical protein